MTNPFDNPDRDYLVLRNGEGQHSLWPSTIETPAGWATVYGPASRQTCLDFVNDRWTDMRPASLVRAMDTGADPLGVDAAAHLRP